MNETIAKLLSKPLQTQTNIILRVILHWMYIYKDMYIHVWISVCQIFHMGYSK